ncbi:alpha/beta fold hydrolase [Chromobacterium haemolyticum]|nr:alpha/beta fold hydrolase [Chromobacterium haemolyticum]
MVLDGVVDIDEAKDSYLMRENQERGYQATFERFAAWCAKTKKCPLSADKAVATQQYIDLLNKLHSSPLSRSDGQQVSANELRSLTTSLLIWHSSWPDLATVVRQLSKGVVGKKVEKILSQQESDSISNLSEDALNVISCVDFSPAGLSQDDILYRRRKIKEAFLQSISSPKNKILLNCAICGLGRATFIRDVLPAYPSCLSCFL